MVFPFVFWQSLRWKPPFSPSVERRSQSQDAWREKIRKAEARAAELEKEGMLGEARGAMAGAMAGACA